MSNNKAGPCAGNEPTRVHTTREVSPAARKFAEYLARRMAPMIQHAAGLKQRNNDAQQN
jgi:hypothetical protein